MKTVGQKRGAEKEGRVLFQVLLRRDIHAQLQRLAEKRDVPMAVLAREIITQKVAEAAG